MLILWWQANIVVESHRARLTDYGLHPIYSDPDIDRLHRQNVDHMHRWQAPEFMDRPEDLDIVKTESLKQADVFSFGMVALEIFTGEVPFNGSWAETALWQIARGKRPKISDIAEQRGLRGGRKTLIKECWRKNPEERPKMEDVVKQLREPDGEAKPKAFCGMLTCLVS